VGAGEAHGSRYAVTIFFQAVEGGIRFYCEIHFGAGDQIVQVARGHVEAAHGIDERGKDFCLAKKRFSWQGLCGGAIKKLGVTCDGFRRNAARHLARPRCLSEMKSPSSATSSTRRMKA